MKKVNKNGGSEFTLDRRRFLIHASQMSALMALAACGSADPTVPAAEEAAAPPVVEAAPAAQEAAVTPGSDLIGELEGPTVITDPTQWPTSFNEAPQLAELVASGQLPPVAERIGQDPLVIQPVHEIGQYGGTWRRGFTGPGDRWNAYRAVSGSDAILYWDYTGEIVVPNIAKEWEISDEGRVITLHLRRGMKWSDGEPLTADDFMFWYNDIYSHEELVPRAAPFFTINGKPGTMEKVDDLTIQYKFPDPYYLIEQVLAGATDLSSHAHNGRIGMGGFAPAHYLQQFHPNYVSQEELDQMVQDEGLDNWVTLFMNKNDWTMNVDLPTVTPWKLKTPINTPVWTYERNPYSIWVDTEGNQLPYIDEVVFTLAEDLEVLNLRAIAGEYDWQARHIDIGKLPVLLQSQEQGNYKVHLDTGNYGSDMLIAFNKTFDGDAEINKWFNTTDFRRALSLGIDREALNEIFWLGTGQPSSLAPADTNPYFPGAEYRLMWATYEPDRANQMLDEIGLAEKDSEGYRLRTDGGGRLRIELMTYGGQFLQYTQMAEVIREQWKDIGIDLQVAQVERSLGESRHAANEHQMFAWLNDGTEHLFTFPGNVLPIANGNYNGSLWGLWYQTDGAEGVEPAEPMKKALANFRKAFGVPEAERIELGKEIWAILVDEVYCIGVVGLSPAAMGIRVVNRNMRNVPARQTNSPDVKNPSISRPVTFFYAA